MSNLGAYQWITATSKKVGGPINLLLLTGAAGAAVSKGIELIVKQCLKAVKNHYSSAPANEENIRLYNIISDEGSDAYLQFVAGEQFRVLEKDEDAVLIEKIGDKNNPYFVSAELIHKISDYK